MATRTAVGFVVLLGVVSLLADTTYEGARSITGPFLATLGASATIVGVVAGFGELIGYGVRLVSGYLGDRTRRYWAITLWGYALNMLAVPALALAGRWECAAALIVLERLGKAVRTPPRDVLLSHAASRMGRGWAFGVHEALDQVGAVAGPLVVAAVLVAARRLYPQPQDFEPATAALEGGPFPTVYWVYLASVACLAAGYADFPLIAFHWKRVGVASDATIPVLYALAMAVDAVVALVLGRLFNRWGLVVVVIVPFFSCLFAPLAFSESFPAATASMILWGVGMGAQESVVRAAVATMIPPARRGTAFGVFNSIYGAAWFAGSALMGILYDLSIPTLVVFSVLSQLAAVPVLYAVRRELPRGAPAARKP